MQKKERCFSGLIVTYKIQLFTPSIDIELNAKKYVLFSFVSHGCVSQKGLDFNKFMWQLVDEAEWLNMMTSYAKVSSGEKDGEVIKNALKEGKIVNKGIK